MAAYRRVYDSRHLQADCHEPDQLRNPTLGNRVRSTFTFFTITSFKSGQQILTKGCIAVRYKKNVPSPGGIQVPT